MKTQSKKIWIKISIIFAILLAITLIIYCTGFSAQFKDLDKYEKIDLPKTEVSKDSLGNFTIKSVDSEFKILQLTDIHLGAGLTTYQKDRWALDTVYDLIYFTKPHLVIITGDMVFPNPISFSINNKLGTSNLIKFFEKIGVNYAVALGNHDNENFSTADREEIANLYDNAPSCLFSIDDNKVYGYGNYVVNVLNRDNTLNTSLFMFDSNSYESYNMMKYDNIHDDQVEWYENKVKELSTFYNKGKTINSLAFFHIPVTAYKTAYDLYKAGSDEVKYFGGECKENNEFIGHPEKEGKLFDKIVELNSTKGIFVGHDHTNDFSLEYKGVRLTYGKAIDYLAYYKIHKNKTMRGGTLITLNRRSQYFQVDHILYDGFKIMPLGKTKF